MASGASRNVIRPIRRLVAVAAAAWVCGFAARAVVCADQAVPSGADDPAKDTRILVLGEGDPTPQDFICREGPRRVTDPIDRFRKELPDGYSARVVIGRFYEPNWGKFDHYVREMVPLDADGKPDGTAKYYQPGRLIRTAEFAHGVQHGEEIFYAYRRDAGGRHRRKVVPYRKGKIDGVVRLFYPDGKTMSETPYVEGRPHGVAKSFAPDGFVRRVVRYRDGKRHGTMTERWSRTQELKKVIEYRDGLAHGSAKMYYDTGRLKMEATLWEDRFHGVEKRYDGDGKLRETRYWILDEPVGKDEFEKRFRMPPKGDPADEQPASRPATAPGRQAGSPE